jgi:hypothetical protein
MTETDQTLSDVRGWRWPTASREWLAFVIVTAYLLVSTPTVPGKWYGMALLFTGYFFGKVIHSKKTE